MPEPREKLTDIIARETYGKSYRAEKYSLDFQEHGYSDQDESPKIWHQSAEPSQKKKYIDLLPLSKRLARQNEQRLTYFLDGSRRVFKVDEIGYSYSGGRRVIYPVIAGQICVGCCRREGRKLFPEKLKREIVIALPDIADPDGTQGFFQAIALKLNASGILRRTGAEISDVLKYTTDRTQDDSRKLEDKATAIVQARMLSDELDMMESVARRLDHTNFLVKDGALEYRNEGKKRSRSSLPPQNYRWIVGLSKTFNPAAKSFKNHENPGYIADLPVNHRTQAACLIVSGLFGASTKFVVWYIRLHDKSRTRSAFDGIVKVEQILATQKEYEQEVMSSDDIDTLSAYILNERFPVCWGKDSRWATHIYPVYLTESYIKSKYISTESFLNLF